MVACGYCGYRSRVTGADSCESYKQKIQFSLERSSFLNYKKAIYLFKSSVENLQVIYTKPVLIIKKLDYISDKGVVTYTFVGKCQSSRNKERSQRKVKKLCFVLISMRCILRMFRATNNKKNDRRHNIKGKNLLIFFFLFYIQTH